MKIRDEIRRMKDWTRRWRAYMVLRHGISLALDAGRFAGGSEEGTLKGILKSALEWNGCSIEDISSN